jgi:hypothetical protein
MSNVIWKQGTNSRARSTTFRGIGIVIRVDKTGPPNRTPIFTNGKLDVSAPLAFSLEAGKAIALETINRLMPENPHWQAAREQRPPG